MPNVLRTATPMGVWKSFVWTVDLTAGLTTGQLYMVNDTVAVAFTGPQGGINPTYGQEASMIYNAEKIRLPKDGTVFNVGDAVYWSGVNEDPVTSTFVSGYLWIAICVKNALAGDSHVISDLLGNKATVGAA